MIQARTPPLQNHPHQQDQQLLPPAFQLCTPPMGKRSRRSLVLTSPRGDPLGPVVEPPQGQAEQRAEAVSRLKMLPMPGRLQEQVGGAPVVHTPRRSEDVCSKHLRFIFMSAPPPQMVLPSSCARNTSYTPYSYSPGTIRRNVIKTCCVCTGCA